MSITSEITRILNAKADIKSAIETKGVTVGDGLIDTYAEKILEISSGGSGSYEQGYEDGYAKAESENPFYYATTLNNIFGGAIFPENYEAVLKVKKAYSDLKCEFMFNNCHYLKTAKLISDDKTNTISFRSTFAKANDSTNQSTLELVDLTDFNRKFSSLQIAFQYQTKLKSILGALDLSECTYTTNGFYYCNSLEDIEFVSNTIPISISFSSCKNLTHDSLMSIINGLYDYKHLDLSDKPLSIVNNDIIESGTYQITNVSDEGDSNYYIEAGTQSFYYHSEMNYGDDYVKLLTVGNDIVIDGEGYGTEFNRTFFGINDNVNAQGVSVTLTLHSTVGASLTEEQKNAIANKNWTLAY